MKFFTPFLFSMLRLERGGNILGKSPAIYYRHWESIAKHW